MRYVITEKNRNYILRDFDTRAISIVTETEYYQGANKGSIIGKAVALEETLTYEGVPESKIDTYYIRRNVLVGSLDLSEICKYLEIFANPVAISSNYSYIVYSLSTSPIKSQDLVDYFQSKGYVQFAIFMYKNQFGNFSAYLRFRLPKFYSDALRFEVHNAVKGEENKGTVLSCGGLVFNLLLGLVDTAS